MLPSRKEQVVLGLAAAVAAVVGGMELALARVPEPDQAGGRDLLAAVEVVGAVTQREALGPGRALDLVLARARGVARAVVDSGRYL